MTTASSGWSLLRLLQHLQPVHPGHLEIDDEDRPALGLELRSSADGPSGSDGDGVAVLLEPAAERLADDLLVVHHQDPGPLVRHGYPSFGDSSRARHSAHSSDDFSSTSRTAGERPMTHRSVSQWTRPKACPTSCTASFASRSTSSCGPSSSDVLRRGARSRPPRRPAAELRLAEHVGEDRDEEVAVGDRRAPSRPGPGLEEPLEDGAGGVLLPPRVEGVARAGRRRPTARTGRPNARARWRRTCAIELRIRPPPHRSTRRRSDPCKHAHFAASAFLGGSRMHRPASPSPTSVLELDLAAVPLDDAVDDRQPEAGALLLRGEERVEDLLQVLRRDPRAGVLERHLDPAPVLDERGLDDERAAPRHRLAGVHDDVHERLPELAEVAVHQRHRGEPLLERRRPGCWIWFARSCTASSTTAWRFVSLRASGRSRAKSRRLRTMAEQRSVSRCDHVEVLHERLARRVVGRPLVEVPDDELREGEDPRERVVDLVGDRGGELAERRELLAADELVLGRPQRGGPLLDLLLQAVHERVEVSLRAAERARHLVERGRQDPELARPGDRDLELQLVAGDPARRLHQRRHRPHHEVAGERVEEHGHEERGERRREERPEPEVGGLRVEARERDADVDDPEHLAVRRVRVARRGRAGPLVVERRHDAEDAPVPAVEDAAAVLELQPVERLPLGVAGDAGLRPPVHRLANLAAVGGEGDPALGVHHADHLDAGLPADVLHDEVGVAAAVLEHRAVQRVADGVGEQVRLGDHLREQVALDRDLGEEEGADGHEGDRPRAAEELRREPVVPRDRQPEVVERARRDRAGELLEAGVLRRVGPPGGRRPTRRPLLGSLRSGGHLSPRATPFTRRRSFLTLSRRTGQRGLVSRQRVFISSAPVRGCARPHATGCRAAALIAPGIVRTLRAE